MKGVDSAHRRNPLLFDLMPAGPRRVGRGRRPAGGRSASRGPAAFFPGAVCSPFPAKPCSSVTGSKFFTQFPRPRWVPLAASRFFPIAGRVPAGFRRPRRQRSERPRSCRGRLHSSKKSPKRIPLRGFFLYFYFPLFIHFHSLGFRSPEVVLYQVNYRAGKQEYRDQVRDNHQTVEGIRQRPEQAQVHGGTDDCH